MTQALADLVRVRIKRIDEILHRCIQLDEVEQAHRELHELAHEFEQISPRGVPLPKPATKEVECCKGLAPISECQCEQERKAGGHPPYHRSAPAPDPVTVEACATVASNFGIGKERASYGGSDIAAAIRALLASPAPSGNARDPKLVALRPDLASGNVSEAVEGCRLTGWPGAGLCTDGCKQAGECLHASPTSNAKEADRP